MSLDGGNHVFACVLCVCVCVYVWLVRLVCSFYWVDDIGHIYIYIYISCCEKMEEMNLPSRRIKKSHRANIHTHPLFCSPKNNPMQSENTHVNKKSQ